LQDEGALDHIDFRGHKHGGYLLASSWSQVGFRRYKEAAADMAAQNTGVAEIVDAAEMRRA
jgi:hypothetical protein